MGGSGIIANAAHIIKSAPKRIGQAVLRLISPSEREFRRIWPTINSIEGFLVSPVQERWLFKAAKSLPEGAVILEIGSFKGRSTCCLAYGCQGTKKHLFAIDTFDGNDIDFHQKGFFNDLTHNVERCGLTAYVTAICGRSFDIARTWDRPINLLFIDGSHRYEDVFSDFYGFFPYVLPGGIVAVHDVVETWPGSMRAWHERIKYQLRDIGYCETLAYGIKQGA